MNIKKILRNIFYSVTAVLLILPVINANAAEPDTQNKQSLQQQIDELKKQIDNAAKQKNSEMQPHQHQTSATLIHMAGYADVGYISMVNRMTVLMQLGPSLLYFITSTRIW